MVIMERATPALETPRLADCATTPPGQDVVREVEVGRVFWKLQ